MRTDYFGRRQTHEHLSIEFVSARAQLIEDRADRELLYALQACAVKDKGLADFAAKLVRSFPDRLGPDALRRLGKPSGGFYSTDQVRVIRKEVAGGEQKFPLKGDPSGWEDILDDPAYATVHPSRYHQNDFIAAYQNEIENLDRVLESLCYSDDVNPEKWKPWYFPQLIESCREIFASEAESEKATFAETTVTRSIFRAAEVAARTRKLALVLGCTRLGKTFAATKYQKMNSGRFRYVEVPVYAEDKEFFRELARALGFVNTARLTASELRMMIEEVLRIGDITLIMDEAQYLLGSSVYPRSIPRRIAWICSLVNKGVGIVLITVPKFLKTLENLAKNTPWDPDQMFGRVAETFPLPNELCREDVISIARKWLPAEDEKAFDLVADLAIATPEFLGAIQSTSQRAIEIARSRGREVVEVKDVEAAAFNGNSASIRSEEQIPERCSPVAKSLKPSRRATVPEDFTHPRLSRSATIQATEPAGK
jgi:hypothetical protein